MSLDDPVRKWLPSLPAAADAIRIRHLLTHTSGLIDYEDVIPEATTAQLHDADVLRLLEPENRTYFAPGTQYRYSNSGYALLALIVGRASGSDFATFLRERIFRSPAHAEHGRIRGGDFERSEPRLRLQFRGQRLEAHRSEFDERGAGRRRRLFLDR